MTLLPHKQKALHEKISLKGFFEDMERLSGRKSKRSTVGLFWHEKKKKFPPNSYREKNKRS